jgi:hypothetical protein
MDKNDDSARHGNPATGLRDIEPAAFASLGNDVVAYLTAAANEGQTGWEVHAADGRVMAVIQGSYEAALAIVRQNALEPVSLH